MRSVTRRTSSRSARPGSTTAQSPICHTARGGTPSMAAGYARPALGFAGTACTVRSSRYQGAAQKSSAGPFDAYV